MADRRVVVVDGSNLATEGRTTPSLHQLDEAVRAYAEEDPEAEIVVVVDASFEHRIDAAERPLLVEAELNGEVVSPPAGAIGRGDAFVLRIAERTGARVLSNDSFQEFHAEHPWLFDDGRLVGGKPVPGVGWIFTPRIPVRGPKSRQATGKTKRAAIGGGLSPPVKAAELARAAKKASARRAPVMPDGSPPKVGDVWPGPASNGNGQDRGAATVPDPLDASIGAAEKKQKGKQPKREQKRPKAPAEAGTGESGTGESGTAAGAPAKKAVAKRAPAKKASTSNAPAKKASTSNAPAKKASTGRVPAKKASTGRVPVGAHVPPAAQAVPPGMAVADVPAAAVPAFDEPVADLVGGATVDGDAVPAEGALADARPAERAPAGRAAKKAPTKEAAAKKAPITKAAAKKAPTKKAAAKKAPTKRAAAKKAPDAAPTEGASPRDGEGDGDGYGGQAGTDEQVSPAAVARSGALQDPALREAIGQAMAEVLSPAPVDAATGADGDDRAKKQKDGKGAKRRHRRTTTPPPAVNEPLAFITFVASYPLQSELEGEVVSFTSHGAMVDVELPEGGLLHCYIPLTAMGDPPPTKARHIVSRGERRRFVLVGLDPLRRVAELAFSGAAAAGAEAG